MPEHDTQPPISVRDLYPEMSDEELAEAEANLERYLLVLMHIHDRLNNKADDTANGDEKQRGFAG
jgi:hypothetical protein